MTMELSDGTSVSIRKDTSASRSEEYEIYEPEINPGNDKFYVNCAGCDREIEFGWSQSNRGGRIFPVECSDFIPGKYSPEQDIWIPGSRRVGSKRELASHDQV